MLMVLAASVLGCRVAKVEKELVMLHENMQQVNADLEWHRALVSNNAVQVSAPPPNTNLGTWVTSS